MSAMLAAFRAASTRAAARRIRRLVPCAPAALAQVPGGSLDPTTVPKYQTPLLIPPVMPKVDTIVRRGQTVDYYEISMKQFAQQILPAGLPATTVWGYGAVK